MTEFNPYVKALHSGEPNTRVAEQFGTSEAKVRRDRKKIKKGLGIDPPVGGDVRVDPKILILDIESRPHLVYAWGLFKQFIHTDQIVEQGGMMCFAAKWLGKDEVVFASENGGRKEMVGRVHSLLSEADVVVTYNGDRYDLKRLNNEFYELGLNPPRPYKSIDLFKQNKSKFDFPSRKLDYLAKVSNVGQKADTGGFRLWLDCMAGDAEAWATMEAYNRQDILLTEELYVRMRPWLTNIPHLGMFTGEVFSCPHCGGTDLTWSGYTNAFVQTYHLYECNSCGAWPRGHVPKGEVIHTRATR